MTRYLTIPVALVYALVYTAARAEETSVSASACAKRLSDRTVVKCEVPFATAKELEQSLLVLLELDATHPGPKVPSLEELHEVERVDDSGRITLRNGLVLLPAGVKCNKEMVLYIRSIFLQEPRYKIAFILTGSELAGAKHAYLWEVEAVPHELSTSGVAVPNPVQFGPAFSSVNEAGLTSKWCIPVQQRNHRYHERYKALVKLK